MVGTHRRDGRSWSGHHEVGGLGWGESEPGEQDRGEETWKGWGEGRCSRRGARASGLLTSVCLSCSPLRKKREENKKKNRVQRMGV